MSTENRGTMNKVQILKVYDCVSKQNRSGISFLQISRETNIPISSVRKYLTEFSSFFVRVGSSTCYTTNRFSQLNSKDSLISAIETTRRQKATVRLNLTIFCFGVAVAISSAVFTAVLNGS